MEPAPATAVQFYAASATHSAQLAHLDTLLEAGPPRSRPRFQIGLA